MEDVSFIDKLNIVSDIILSSPLFLVSILLIEIALIVYLLIKKGKLKLQKWMIISIWSILALIIIVIYHKVFFNLIDNFINYIFTALYFPNLAVYISVILISNIFYFISVFNKKINKKYNIINITNALLLDILMIFIIDIVNKNNIDIYEKVTVFSNSKLLVLLELSTGIFTSWILLNIFISLKEKLRKYDKAEYPDMPEIIFN